MRSGLALLFALGCGGTAAPPTPAPVTLAPPGPAPSAPSAFVGPAHTMPGGVTAIWAQGDAVFAAGRGFVQRSDDGGATFHKLAVSAPATSLFGFSATDVYLGTENGVLHSTDGEHFGDCGPAGVVHAVQGRDSFVYALYADGVRMLHGGCAAFAGLMIGRGAEWLHDLAFYGERGMVLAGKGPGNVPLVRVARESASSYDDAPLAEKEGGSNAVCVSGTTIYAAGPSALHVSRSGGAFEQLVSAGAEILALACRGDEVIVGARNRTVLVSHDAGKTWDAHPLDDAVFGGPELVAAQAAFISDRGDAYVGFESYGKGGTLLRRVAH